MAKIVFGPFLWGLAHVGKGGFFFTNGPRYVPDSYPGHYPFPYGEKCRYPSIFEFYLSLTSHTWSRKYSPALRMSPECRPVETLGAR